MANEDSVYNESQCGGEGGGHVDEQFDILLVKALIYLSRWKDHHLVVLQKISNQSNLVPAPSETCWFRGMSVGGSFRRV